MTQFQLKQWSAEGLCSNPQALIDVIDKIGVIQRRTGNKPIVVHGKYAYLICSIIIYYYHEALNLFQ